jgi:hypothetical protein
MAAQKRPRPLPPPASNDNDDSRGHVRVRRAAASRGGGGSGASHGSSDGEPAARRSRAPPREPHYGGESADISVSRQSMHERIAFDAMGCGYL